VLPWGKLKARGVPTCFRTTLADSSGHSTAAWYVRQSFQKQVGTPRAFNFTPRQHFELGEALGMMDFATASKLAGSVHSTARPARPDERALAVHARPAHQRARLRPKHRASLVNEATAYGTGSLPKFEEDLFKTTTGFYLIPTARCP